MEIGMVDRIMLDNFEIADLREALKIIQGRFETEASGGNRTQVAVRAKCH